MRELKLVSKGENWTVSEKYEWFLTEFRNDSAIDKNFSLGENV